MRLEPFTWATYGHYLDAALESGYRFIGFAGLTDVSRLPDYPFILLRHDIDYDPSLAVPMCRLDAKRGIRATYCFQQDSPFYRFESEETASMIREVLDHGNWLGVHFDANGIAADPEVVRRVEEAARCAERRFGCTVSAVSFHRPTYRPIGHLELANGRVNTYAPLFFQAIEYASDSNQHFRDKDVLKLFREARVRRLQLLIHPMWWRETYTPLSAKIEQLAAKLGISSAEILTAEQRALIGGAEDARRP